VLLATGIVDVHPRLEQLDKAIAEGSIRYCPVCDGFEALDRTIAVLGDGEDASSKASFMRTYSKDVTLLWQKEKPRAQTAWDDGFAVEGPVSELKRCGHGIRASLGTRSLDFDIVYPVMGCDARSELASRLGAATTDVGCLKVDAHQRTTVDGLYAAGDVVSDLHQIAVATGHAAVAATTFISACRAIPAKWMSLRGPAHPNHWFSVRSRYTAAYFISAIRITIIKTQADIFLRVYHLGR
jgi:thioredoxin reductase (NADPH)